MAAEDIKSSIGVQKLISVFENRVTETQASFFRPRARSLGHLLSKDVVVPVREFKTLKDVERVLEITETELDNYQVYNKAKHVAFQEDLFNTLTSIINIDTDDQIKADSLIKRTKMLVSILNNKLPSNNTVTLDSDHPDGLQKSKPTNIYLKSNQNVTKKEVEAINENEEVNVSVKKLKEKFQSFEKKAEEAKPIIKTKKMKEKFQSFNKKEEKAERNIKTKITYSKSFSHRNEKNTKVPTNVTKGPAFPADEDYYDPEPIKVQKVQVNQLRNIFEKKLQEGSTGIPLILKENKPPITRFNYKSNQDAEPDITLDYNSNKITETKSSRLLTLLEKENENHSRHFQHELSISEENDDGEVVQVETNQTVSQFGSMSNLEPIEDDDNVSDVSSGSQESLKTVESLKLVDNNDKDNVYMSIESDTSFKTAETFTSTYNGSSVEFEDENKVDS